MTGSEEEELGPGMLNSFWLHHCREFTLKITFSSDLSRVFRVLVFLLVKRTELLSFSFEHSLGLKNLICTFDDVIIIRSSHVRSKCCKAASAKDLLMRTIL